MAFILRAFMSCLRDSLFVQGVGLPQDVTIGPHGEVSFIPEGPVRISTRKCNYNLCVLFMQVPILENGRPCISMFKVSIFAFFYDFSNRVWYCSDSVAFLFILCHITTTKPHLYVPNQCHLFTITFLST